MPTPEPPLDRPSPDGGPTALRPGRLLALAAGAGLIAGLLAWLAGEASLTMFRPPTVRAYSFGQAIDRASYPDQAVANFKNAVLAYAELGACLGLTLGLAGAIARGSRRAALRSGALGASIGAVLATMAAMAALPIYFRAEDRDQEALARDLILPMVVHVAAWGASGLAGGLALSLGLGGSGGRARAVRMATGGLIGAAIGTLAYEVAGATLFPDARTAEPLSWTWGTRLFARLMVAIPASVVAAAMAEPKPRRKSGPAATPEAGPDPAPSAIA